MIVYFDTSALAPAFVDPVRHRRAAAAVLGRRIASALLTYAETLGMFGALERSGAVAPLAAARITSELVAWWPRVMGIRLEPRLLPDVRRCIAHHGLRGADAVQLASALHVARGTANTGEPFRFACDDRALRRAAEDEGLELAW